MKRRKKVTQLWAEELVENVAAAGVPAVKRSLQGSGVPIREVHALRWHRVEMAIFEAVESAVDVRYR